jgi:hypothetical protein
LWHVFYGEILAFRFFHSFHLHYHPLDKLHGFGVVVGLFASVGQLSVADGTSAAAHQSIRKRHNSHSPRAAEK